jgi:hypothetical protein
LGSEEKQSFDDRKWEVEEPLKEPEVRYGRSEKEVVLIRIMLLTIILSPPVPPVKSIYLSVNIK